jgi:hypothetical protein
MTDLLERLIEEARLHGRAALERENAIAALENSGRGLAKTVEALENLRIAHGTLLKTTEALRDELHESRTREQAGIVALRDMNASIEKYIWRVQKEHGKKSARDRVGELVLAKAAADKTIKSFVPF